MERPTNMWFKQIPDDTAFEIIDRYTVRFAFPEPEGLAFVKFWSFPQIAPAFFRKYKFSEKNWAYLPESGPWGTGPFKLVEGSLRFGKPGKRVVLEAYERYWDRQYPKVQKLIFDNTLIGNREEAMRLCRETEGAVDIVTHIRPLDTLKVAESQFAKVVKSKDVNHLRCWFNQRKRDSKWRDVRLRKAVNYAVNREELWKYAAKGNAYNLGCYIPPGAYGHNPDLNLYTYDTTKARALLAEAGYPDGFEMNIITSEPWKLEAQIITSMLGRIGLKARLEILTWPEFLRQTYLPLMDSPPEQQLWDLSISYVHDYHGHTGASFLTYVFLDSSDFRWIAYDPVYEKMWEDMTRIVDSDTQEEKIQWMVKYLYDHAHFTPIYSPLSLYAVNKEVNFIPHKCGFLRLKETSVTENHWSVKGENE
jgi:peptide/nickel transport system substrate-binding protein